MPASLNGLVRGVSAATMEVMILGPAGSGKSLLTASFGKYLQGEGFIVKFVNLDPGCAVLPYKCDYDVRGMFTVEGIMQSEELGPNGAMLRAMEKLCNVEIPKFSADFTLIDTPGQLEVFAFHKSGPKIVKSLEDPVGIFIIDGTIEIEDLPAIYLYALAVRYRLGINMITTINKADLLDEAKAEKVKDYLLNPSEHKEKLEFKGVLHDIYTPLSEILQTVIPAQRIPLISAKTGKGLDELLNMLYEVKCVCGDLT
ncbi:MAG: ATP/GTP-binding protein [Candidatus Bathyarchaeia archaeon]